jgi:heme/copper-type cytochrome/quinol oxidase subunit 3
VTAGVLDPRAVAAEQPSGRRTAWWGLALFVVTEAAFFASFLAAYFYVNFKTGGDWPPEGIEVPKLARPSVMTGLLVSSSLTTFLADRAIEKGRRLKTWVYLACTVLLAVGFLGLQYTEYAEKLKEFTPSTNAYGSFFYTITGFHGLHVVIGVLMLSVLVVATLRGQITGSHHIRVRIVGIYWHFVDVVWLAVFSSLYLSPHLLATP